jgi:hypothetical protein
MAYTPTVAVDFDGVIHAYSRGWQNGTIYEEPLPGAFDALRKLMDTYAVFVHTTRDPKQVGRWIKARSGIETAWFEILEDVPEFWNERGTLLVTQRKLPAVAYIDDRGIRFESWAQALADLEKFTTRKV